MPKRFGHRPKIRPGFADVVVYEISGDGVQHLHVMECVGRRVEREESEMSQNYEPFGFRFFDNASNRQMMIVYATERRESIRGWLLYRHPDGQWVTLRKATADDRSAINRAAVEGHHAD